MKCSCRCTPRTTSRELSGASLSFFSSISAAPTTYSEERGHPRLRMRHAAFTVNPEAKEHWLTHMRSALDSLELAPMDDEELWDYLQRAALSMVNTFEP